MLFLGDYFRTMQTYKIDSCIFNCFSVQKKSPRYNRAPG